MRRIEVTSQLSPKLKQALQTLLDLDQETLEAAWHSCSQKGRGYFTHKIRQAPSGKIREIHIAQPAMHTVQQRILKRVLYSLPISKAAFGGIPKRSHVGAAKTHLQQAGEILQCDIVNAFSTTSYHQVSKALRSRLKSTLVAFSLNAEERRALVGFLVHLMVVSPAGGRFPKLPLGTPTSLAAFNLVWAEIDAEIIKLCHQLSPNDELRYTRYVDDLTFSSNQHIPQELMPRLVYLLKKHGYTLNEEKTRRAHRDQAIIHGLCWRNEQLDLPDQSILNLAKRVHRLQALVTGHPTPQQWQQASQLLKELDFLVQEVYGEESRPQGLVVSSALRQLINTKQHQPARWADELWG